jgi:methionine-gamma-lyase
MTEKIENKGERDVKEDERNRKKWDSWRFETQLMRAGEEPYPETSHSLRVPIYATKSYTFPKLDDLMQDRYYYSRTENPTRFALSNKLATLHGGEACVCVASGMAAIHQAVSSVIQKHEEHVKSKKGKKLLPQSHPEDIPNIIIHNNQYTGTHRLFNNIYPQMGIECRRVNMEDLSEVNSAVDENTKLIFAETPVNPNVHVLDIRGISDIIHEVGGISIVDNTWASPSITKPLEFGADIVVESLTKYINGHGDALGGAILADKNRIRDIRYYWNETQGAVLSPFDSYLVLRGVKTLDLRMKKHSENALKVAKAMEKHKNVVKVTYPGLKSHPQYELAQKQMRLKGGMVGLELESEEACMKFIDNLDIIKIGVSLGDTTSLIEYTTFMTGIDLSLWERKSMQISKTHFRLSVGLEDARDLIKDLKNALAKI